MTRSQSNFFYICLGGIFISSLVSCNLIFQKFFEIEIWLPFIGHYTFVQSVGLLPYPITFLVTDIISELFGKKKANQVVTAGLIASIFMVLVVILADSIPSASFGTGSPDTVYPPLSLKENTFHVVFGLSGAAVFGSMVAYLFAQYVDVRVFHFWKNLTKGKHLWLRNNCSTIFSQLIDTFIILVILFYFDVLKPPDGFTSSYYFIQLFLNGFLFKVFFAAFDTPIIYGILYLIRKKFNLKFGEELP